MVVSGALVARGTNFSNMRSIPKQRILRVNCPGYGVDSYFDLKEAKELKKYTAIIVNPSSIVHLYKKDLDLVRRVDEAIAQGQTSLSVADDEILRSIEQEVETRIIQLSDFLTQGGVLVYFLSRPFTIYGPTLSLDNYCWLESLAPDQPNEPNIRQMSAVSQGRLVDLSETGLQSEFGAYLLQQGIEWSTIIREEKLTDGYSALATAGPKKCIAGQLFIMNNTGRVVFLPAPFSPDFDRTLISCLNAWYSKKEPSIEEIAAEQAEVATAALAKAALPSAPAGPGLFKREAEPVASVEVAADLSSMPSREESGSNSLRSLLSGSDDNSAFEESVSDRINAQPKKSSPSIDLSVFAQTARQLVEKVSAKESAAQASAPAPEAPSLDLVAPTAQSQAAAAQSAAAQAAAAAAAALAAIKLPGQASTPTPSPVAAPAPAPATTSISDLISSVTASLSPEVVAPRPDSIPEPEPEPEPIPIPEPEPIVAPEPVQEMVAEPEPVFDEYVEEPVAVTQVQLPEPEPEPEYIPEPVLDQSPAVEPQVQIQMEQSGIQPEFQYENVGIQNQSTVATSHNLPAMSGELLPSEFQQDIEKNVDDLFTIPQVSAAPVQEEAPQSQLQEPVPQPYGDNIVTDNPNVNQPAANTDQGNKQKTIDLLRELEKAKAASQQPATTVTPHSPQVSPEAASAAFLAQMPTQPQAQPKPLLQQLANANTPTPIPQAAQAPQAPVEQPAPQVEQAQQPVNASHLSNLFKKTETDMPVPNLSALQAAPAPVSAPAPAPASTPAPKPPQASSIEDSYADIPAVTPASLGGHAMNLNAHLEPANLSSQHIGVNGEAPGWSKEYTFNFLDTLRKHEYDLNEQMNDLQAKLDTLRAKIEYVDYLKQCLISGGINELKDACTKVLQRLGWTVNILENNQNEFLLLSGEHPESLVRMVAGAEQCPRGEVASLAESAISFWDDHEVEPKGVLIACTWNTTDPHARTEPEFGEAVNAFARKKNLCLVTSLQLLAIYRDLELGFITPDDVRKQILETSGQLNGYQIEAAMATV